MAGAFPIPQYETRTEDIEGYTSIKHANIPMLDGVQLCQDVFLPFSVSKSGAMAPVPLRLGPYNKDVHASVFGLPHTHIYADVYKDIKPLGPDAAFELMESMLWVRLSPPELPRRARVEYHPQT